MGKIRYAVIHARDAGEVDPSPENCDRHEERCFPAVAEASYEDKKDSMVQQITRLPARSRASERLLWCD